MRVTVVAPRPVPEGGDGREGGGDTEGDVLATTDAATDGAGVGAGVEGAASEAACASFEEGSAESAATVAVPRMSERATRPTPATSSAAPVAATSIVRR